MGLDAADLALAAAVAAAARPPSQQHPAAAVGAADAGQAPPAAAEPAGPEHEANAAADTAVAAAADPAAPPLPPANVTDPAAATQLRLQQQPQLQLQPLLARHPLEGLWRGSYGAHGIEMVVIKRAGPALLLGRKLTGEIEGNSATGEGARLSARVCVCDNVKLLGNARTDAVYAFAVSILKNFIQPPPPPLPPPPPRPPPRPAGDANVPAGHHTFRVYLDTPGRTKVGARCAAHE